MIDLSTLKTHLEPYKDDVVRLAQKLIQTPSPPGQEEAAARIVAEAMKRLDYDEVWVDNVGNAIGLLYGEDRAHSVMLNAHLDHVGVGDEQAWTYPPFSGTITDGRLWGRGAVDLKGSVAAMVVGVGALRRQGIVPPWDVYVAAVVLEEQGGMGTEVVLRSLRPDFCVIGEATGNQLALGHRGGIGAFVEIQGRAAHASMADVGINPHYSAARFLLALRNIQHDHDPMLGYSSATPTLYTTDQSSSNVIPGRVRLYVDWRSVPGQTVEGVLARLEALLRETLESGTTGRVRARSFPVRSHTGMEFTMPAGRPAVKLDPKSELACRSHRALEVGLGRAVAQIIWRFCTDGAVCAEFGVPIVGFGPGQQEMAHTTDERIPIADLHEALVGAAALALSPGLCL